MATAKKPFASGKVAIGCLLLVAIPFAAVGIGMTWRCVYIAWRHTAMQSWVEVPATITKAELLTHDGEKSDTFQAVAAYEYEFGGRQFTSEQVGIDGGSDNIGRFQRDAYQELKEHLDQRKPFRCFVNPDQPSEAVLYRQLRGEILTFNTLFATTFGAIGLGLLTAGCVATRQMPENVADEMSADQPWLVRSDWATGRIHATGGAALAAPVLAVIGMYWTIASLPLVWKLPDIVRQGGSMWRWVALVFPIANALMFAAFFHQFFAARKFGESVFQMASVPGVVGGPLAGVVRISRVVLATEGFRIRLTCLERRIRRRQETEEVVLWQDERLVTETLGDGSSGETTVPVLFAIPYAADETSRPDSNRDIEWRLEVSAKLPGVDYRSRFEVPVFKTAESRRDFELDASLAADYAAPPNNDLLLGEAGVRKELLAGGGVRLVFTAARNWPSALVVSAFVVVFGGIFALVDMPLAPQIILGVLVTVFSWVALDLWLYRSVVEASADGLTVCGGWLGVGPTRRIAAADVKRFTSKETMSSGANVWRSIEVVPRQGKRRTLGKGIVSKLVERAVIDELNAALGQNC